MPGGIEEQGGRVTLIYGGVKLFKAQLLIHTVASARWPATC